MRKALGAMGAILLAVGFGAWSAAQEKGTPTKIVVRAVASDAKLIGDNVGGVRITLREAESGDILVQGIQQGNTGDTERIVKEPHRRGASLYDTEGAAKFEATLELARPTRVEIIAEGPLGYPHAMQQASKTVLLVPGRDVTGDGVVLTIHGFIVELLQPQEDQEIAGGAPVSVQARVRMA